MSFQIILDILFFLPDGIRGALCHVDFHRCFLSRQNLTGAGHFFPARDFFAGLSVRARLRILFAVRGCAFFASGGFRFRSRCTLFPVLRIAAFRRDGFSGNFNRGQIRPHLAGTRNHGHILKHLAGRDDIVQIAHFLARHNGRSRFLNRGFRGGSGLFRRFFRGFRCHSGFLGRIRLRFLSSPFALVFHAFGVPGQHSEQALLSVQLLLILLRQIKGNLSPLDDFRVDRNPLDFAVFTLHAENHEDVLSRQIIQGEFRYHLYGFLIVFRRSNRQV